MVDNEKNVIEKSSKNRKFSAYTMRSVLNITITQMVRREAENGTHHSDLTCPSESESGKSARDGFDWSEELQGTILGCFFYGYVSSMTVENEKK